MFVHVPTRTACSNLGAVVWMLSWEPQQAGHSAGHSLGCCARVWEAPDHLPAGLPLLRSLAVAPHADGRQQQFGFVACVRAHQSTPKAPSTGRKQSIITTQKSTGDATLT